MTDFLYSDKPMCPSIENKLSNFKIFGSENFGPKLARTEPERTVFRPFLTVFYVNSLSTLFLKYSASRLVLLSFQKQWKKKKKCRALVAFALIKR